MQRHEFAERKQQHPPRSDDGNGSGNGNGDSNVHSNSNSNCAAP
jgi:hypothetical protein